MLRHLCSTHHTGYRKPTAIAPSPGPAGAWGGLAHPTRSTCDDLGAVCPRVSTSSQSSHVGSTTRPT